MIKKGIKQIPAIGIILIYILIISCEPAEPKPPVLHTLATIKKDKVETFEPYLQSDGYANNTWELRPEEPIDKKDFQYEIEFVSDDFIENNRINTDSNTNWIPWEEAGYNRCGPFIIEFPDYKTVPKKISALKPLQILWKKISADLSILQPILWMEQRSPGEREKPIFISTITMGRPHIPFN